MLLTKEIEVNLSSRNIKWYESKGYIIPKWKDKKGRISIKQGTKLIVKIEDLPINSHAKINISCDECGKTIKNIKWVDYLKHLHENNNYYCQKCANNLFVKEKRKKTLLLNSESFYDWCYRSLNKKQADEIMARWDYNLNKYSPKEVSFSSCGINGKGYYFKCLKHPEHESELKNISRYTQNHGGELECKACNSIGQYILDTYGENGLNLYWNYEKNNKLGLSPFKIDKGSHKFKIWIFCQEHNYHESYDIRCKDFVKGDRCPYCSGNSGKVHPLDSIGQYMIDNYGQEFLDKIWSKKNIKSPFAYKPSSGKYAYWKCLDGKHKDYYRSIKVSNICKFRCPTCQFSKGEKRIEKYLEINKFTENKDYISQKEFDGLLGLGNGNLSYDFYLINYNLLIEYQGEQHEKYIKGFHKSKKDFETQQEHDRRKKQYCIDNNIKLLPIWYWDYENIEEILDHELNINNKESKEEVS